MPNEYEVVSIDPRSIQLDARNPRIPLEIREAGFSQSELLAYLIRHFKLDDLGRSIVASGYTDIDPLIGYREDGHITVREGNRRIATLKLLLEPALAPEAYQEKWRSLSDEVEPDEKERWAELGIRVFADPEDADLEAYIGFRHVSGVLEWPAEEKARFIVEMVERHDWSFDQIAERLGSYPKHIERHYIASRLIDQAKQLQIDGAENITIGVLLRALQARGVSDFLGVTYPGDPRSSLAPVPEDKLEDLTFFVWSTFGSDTREAVLPESRQLTKWGQILQSAEAVRYLKSSSRPSFERAWAKSGGEHESVVEMLHAAADNLEDSLPVVPDYSNAEDVIAAVDRCTRRLKQLLRDFPDIRERVFESD